MKLGSLLALILSSLLSIGHLIRLVGRIEFVANGVVIPLWVSLPGCLVTGAIAWLLWRERR